MSSGSCVICLEPLVGQTTTKVPGTEQPIGVCVPCGHCLHVGCWESWAASRLGCRDAKCPSCNQSSSTFVRLYLDLGGTNNADDGGDDDASLSSCESASDTKSVVDDAENAPNVARAGYEVECFDLTAVDEIVPVASSSVEMIEVNPGNDEYMSQEINTIRKSTAKLRGATKCKSDNDRYKRMAKSLKQRVAILGSQKQEFGKERVKLVKLLQTQSEDLVERQRLLQRVENEHNILERNLDALKLAVTQSKRKQGEMETILTQTRREADEAKSVLRESQAQFQRKLESAKAMSMPEVQRMNEEIRNLREEVKILQRQRGRGENCPPTGRSQPAMTLKATQQMLRTLSESRECQTKSALNGNSGAAHRAFNQPVDTLKLSAHAHRMRTEIDKPRARKAQGEALSILDATDNIPKSMEPSLAGFFKSQKVRRTSAASAILPPRADLASTRIRPTSAQPPRTLGFPRRR